jgi:hypothetical protein
MIQLSRPTALIALSLPLALAACGDVTEKARSEAKPAGERRTEAKELEKPKAEAKAPTDTKAAADSEDEAEIKKNLEKLDPADRKLAEAQRFCVIEDDRRLGEMGKPLKLTIKDKPVFLCCAGCKKQALADPDKTLAKVEELKRKAASAK